ncbi:acyl carrier protein [Rhodocytophaga aerolata]|uniref:Acyl carrier protein n=1 Tax=Rhodocytophaga aerolata TaxID=455078 RepID=A0ABT8RBW0_9BACT|nr:acyl carrier protein [Rhodocytophaga aerolata]MDO1449598.1 acyl carrier protein [Rhodocytophaga aerolata]
MKQSIPDVKQIVSDILQTKMGVDKRLITSQSHLIRELGLDSLDRVELIVDVETQFDITISDEELESLVTLQDLIVCIEEKLSFEDKRSII